MLDSTTAEILRSAQNDSLEGFFRSLFSRDLAELLLDDFRRTLDYFAQHPVATPLTEHEAGGHNHTGRFKKKREEGGR